MPITTMKPMLAAQLGAGEYPQFPTLATPKLDGIRALKLDGKLVSRTLKPIPNDYIRERLERLLPDGADGEILYGQTFQDCTSMVMSANKIPTTPVIFSMFDYVLSDPLTPYDQRIENMRHFFDGRQSLSCDFVIVKPLYPTLINTKQALDAFEDSMLSKNFEGVIARKPDGKYKYGRSSVREGLLLKIKRFTDDEAVVIGFEQLLHNGNEASVDALGHAKRSSHKHGKTKVDALGAIVVKKDDVTFKIGTGFTAEDRKTLWEQRDGLMNKLVKYKYLGIGTKTAPRHPVFLGFRSEADVGEAVARAD